MKRIYVFNKVEMRFGLWKYTFLVMQKYGHDESVPYACGMFVGISWIVRHIIIIYVTHHRNSSATRLFRDGYAF